MRGLTLRDPAAVGRVLLVALADMAGLWRLNEAGGTDNAVDASANGNTLTKSGADAATAATGKVDGCRQLTADCKFLGTSLTGLPTGISDSCTIFGWAKHEAGSCVGGSPKTLTFGGYGVAAYTVEVYNTASKKFTFTFPYNGWIDIDVVSTEAWHFFAFGYDAATGKAWASVDVGARQELTPGGSWVAPSAATVQMGELGGSPPVQENIDHIGIIDQALTDVQLAWLYNGGSGRDLA